MRGSWPDLPTVFGVLGPRHGFIRPSTHRARAALLSVLAIVLVLSACTFVGDGGFGQRGEALPDEVGVADSDALNIVEIVADDLRYDDLRYAPNLRRLVADEGVSMRNGFSSYPLCCPARASFFSGLEAHNHGVYDIKRPYGYRAFDDSTSLATALKEQGYATGLVGKYLNGYGNHRPLQLAREAEEAGYDGPIPMSQYFVPDGWDEWQAAITGVDCDPACGDAYSYFNYAYTDNGTPTSAGWQTYSTTLIGEQSVDLAHSFHQQRAATGAPFFLSVNHIAPHNDLSRKRVDTVYFRNPQGRKRKLGTPTAPAWAMRLPMVRAIDRPLGVRRNWTGEKDLSDKPGRLANGRPTNPSARRAQVRLARARAASIVVMDRQIKRLVEQLKADGEWDRTVLTFWSDNGFFQGEHGRMDGKVDPYDPALRVPILFTGPGMRDGSTRDDPMTVTDLTATLLDIADAEPPHEPDGSSLLPVLNGSDLGWTSGVLTEAGVNPVSPGRVEAFRGDPRTSIGVRTARYLYVRHRSGEREIYDNWRDPQQWDNLAVDRRWMAEHSDVVDALQQAWSSVKDCAGTGCEAPLPSLLQVDAATNTDQTDRFYDYFERYYYD
ncbi:sulfatase-like hydrolase/transferase [Nocardioides sp. BGMRC 2183]|nr:sulfatase-like hydrolase/transferase [Nocardioides sp. BGMRC 2183]